MKSDRMERVAAVAKLLEAQKARELGLCQQDHRDKAAQLDQLLQFREDYESILRSRGSEGITASQLCDHRAFLNRLSAAVEQQTAAVALVEQDIGSLREEWLVRSRRTSALEQLAKQRVEVLRSRHAKAEQRACDERPMLRIEDQK